MWMDGTMGRWEEGEGHGGWDLVWYYRVGVKQFISTESKWEWDS